MGRKTFLGWGVEHKRLPVSPYASIRVKRRGRAELLAAAAAARQRALDVGEMMRST